MMMTKDNNAASSTPNLVSVSTQAAVLVTLPTTMTTADMGTHILHGTAIKEEADDDLNATLAVGTNVSSSFSNGNIRASGVSPLCPKPIVLQAHCLPVPLYASPIAYQSHCLLGPLYACPIVCQAHCVPLCSRPIASQAHCAQGPLCTRPVCSKPIVSQANCVY